MEIAQSLQQIQSSYIREILAAASDPNVISLKALLNDYLDNSRGLSPVTPY